MDKPIRLATNNRVEIIDNSSPYFCKTGRVEKIEDQPLQMMDLDSKTINSKIIYYVFVKLDGSEIIEKFTLKQVKKIS